MKCQNSLFALLGQAFAYKCMLSPLAEIYIWRTCNLPVLISGLPALPIRPCNIKALEIFHRKILRGILKLSQASPVPALNFLLGKLPLEGVLHARTLGLVYNLWVNPQLSVHNIVAYILKMSKPSSTTWANHISLLCRQYDLPCPIHLLQSEPWPKDRWTTLVNTRIATWHQSRLRSMSQNNSQMIYINTKLLGLSGRPHPALCGITCTQDVKKLRMHLKFLSSLHVIFSPKSTLILSAPAASVLHKAAWNISCFNVQQLKLLKSGSFPTF